MRFFVAALLLFHGLIHVMGFLKPFKLAEVPQLSGPASRLLGLLWLLATLLFVTAAVLEVLKHDVWWVPGALAIVLSQALIFSQWSDAKAGTVANVLLIIPVVMSVAISRFHADNEVAARALLEKTAPADVVSASELERLPAPVQRWLRRAGIVGQPRAKTVRLLQRGGMRTAKDKPFAEAAATQYFTVDEPRFVWTIDLMMMGLPVVGRDSYLDGRARMLIKAGGLITVADGTGPKFDQGTLLRFLGEIIWFPSAALAPYLTWEAVDDRHARATLTWKDTSASGVFEFDEQDRVSGFTARRYFNGETLEDWAIPITGWKRLRGVEMPTAGTALWKLADGDLEYYRWEILDVEQNPERLQ